MAADAVPDRPQPLVPSRAELAVARAAARHGLLYGLSTLGTTRLEDLAKALAAPRSSRFTCSRIGGSHEFVARCKEAGLSRPGPDRRHRSPATGARSGQRPVAPASADFQILPELRASSRLVACRPCTGARFDFANVSHRVDALAAGPMSLFDYIGGQFDRSVTWRDVEWLAAEVGWPTGDQGCDDARGRQTCNFVRCHRSDDFQPWRAAARRSSRASRPGQLTIRDAIGEGPDVICDGGVRRGSDGGEGHWRWSDGLFDRPTYLYGLAAGAKRELTSRYRTCPTSSSGR